MGKLQTKAEWTTRSGSAGSAAWRTSDFVCAFADGERHLGHVVRDRQWLAYDATHTNEAANGFKYLGSFAALNAAKRAVESALAEVRHRKTMGAPFLSAK